MNIFIVDDNPREAAKMLCDRHVNKMILESAQMLSSVADRWGWPTLYRPTHRNHPCTLWAGDSYENWLWLVEHSVGLWEEKLHRTDRGHASIDVINYYADNNFGPVPKNGLTKFAQAMPDKYKNDDPVVAYRSYYVGEKQFFRDGRRPVWTGRQPPSWWEYRP